MTRVVLRAAAIAFLALVLLASDALAGESIGSGSWSGSALQPQPGPSTSGELTVAGAFRHSAGALAGKISLRFTVTPPDAACAVANPADLPRGWSPRSFSVTFTVPCNGRYHVRIDARSDYGGSAWLDQTIEVAMPAPAVTNVVATASGRTVELTWDDMRPAAPDLAGYVVERRLGSAGQFVELASLGVDDTSYTDDDLPAAGGEATYRVLGTRPAPDGSVVRSQSSTETATPFDPAPATGGSSDGDRGSGGDGGGSTSPGGADAGAGAVPGGEGAPAADGPGSSGGRTSGRRVRAPRTFSGTFFPPLLQPPASITSGAGAPTTATTLDDGYDERLPYERPPEGEGEVAAVDEGGFTSIFTPGEAGRGLVIPTATALVLAMWAVLLRLLARAARPDED